MGEWKSRTDSLAEELLTVYEELNIYYDISASLSYSPDLEKTIDLILNKAMGIVEVDKASVMVLDESGNTLSILRRWEGGNPINVNPRHHINWKGTILEKVVQAKKGFIINDVPRSANPVSPLIAVKSLLCIPLRGKEGIIGLLTLGDRKIRDFTSSDLKLAMVLSSQVALVVENSRLIQAYLEKQNLEKELQIAREIQERFQPVTPPQLPGYEMAALSIPCIQVGGDFYDFITLPNDRIVILIGDVMGHGIGAALLMATVKSALRILSEENIPIGEIFTRINRMLIKDHEEKRILLTLFYGILEWRRGKLTFANAGHEYPIVLRSSAAQCEFLESTGTILGAFEDSLYKQSEVQLNPGDMVLFYTDGVVEEKGSTEENFGKDRLCQWIQRNKSLPAQELLNAIYRELAGFSGSKMMNDDLLLCTVKLAELALANEKELIHRPVKGMNGPAF